jgi:hypothetical protein
VNYIFELFKEQLPSSCPELKENEKDLKKFNDSIEKLVSR